MTGENTVDPKLQWFELQPLTFMRFIMVIKTPTVTTKTCIYNQYMQKSPQKAAVSNKASQVSSRSPVI
jgi:hypothetical protein